jgi:peptidoglycan/LPS O-acetylase OafA/YrhL
MFWAVVIEFQCYFIFPLVIRLSNAFGIKVLFALVLFTIGVRLFVFEVQPSGTARDLSYASIYGRFDQFLIGMITAKLYVEGAFSWVNRKTLAASVACVFLIVTAFNQAGGFPVDAYWKLFWPTLEGAMWGVFIISFFIRANGAIGKVSMIAAKIGEFSYSTYHWHFSIIVGVVQAGFLPRIAGDVFIDSMVTTLLFVLLPTLVMGYVSFHLIEKPFLALRPKYIRAD